MYADAPDDDSDDEEETKTKNELGEFAGKISIAGIEDAYKAESPFVRGLFLGSIVVFTLAMIYSSCNVGIRYAQEDAIALNWRPIDNEPAPFPNVSICFPMMTNEEAKKDLIYTNPEVQRKVRRLNVSQEEAGGFLVSEFFKMGSSSSPKKMRLRAVAERILDASIREYSVRGFLQRLVSCQRSLVNCYFHGVEFDCCRTTTFMANFNMGICWEMNLAKITNSTNSSSLTVPATDHSSIAVASGLTIEVRYDPSSVVFDEDQLASDGFMVLLDPPSLLSSSPAIVPQGADAHVILAPPVRNRDIDRCDPVARKLTKYADRYDARGLYCGTERMINEIVDTIGCSIPVLTYYPDEMNDTMCDGITFAKVVETMSSNGGTINLPMEEMEKYFKNDSRKFDAMIGHFDMERRDVLSGRWCPPACQRWTYSVWSTSYGYIKYADDESEQNSERFANGNKNRSRSAMSRIRIFFLTPSYEIWSQERVALFYLAFCEIAGVWGVYLGFSIVTVVQMLAYGVMIVRIVRKRRKERGSGNKVADSGGSRYPR